MVHYGRDPWPQQPPPPVCPKCGSHRTEVIGRLEDGRTLIVRCNACGAHSTVMIDELAQDYIERLSFEETSLALTRAARDVIHRGSDGNTA